MLLFANCDRIFPKIPHLGRVGERTSIRPMKVDPAIVRDGHLEPVLVYRPVMQAAQKKQIVQPGVATVGPVFDVMCVTEPEATAREAAALVSAVERPPDSRWDHARLPSDIEHGSFGVVSHDDTAGVASQPPGRFRGNANALLQVGFVRYRDVIGLPGFAERLGVYAEHDLEAVGPPDCAAPPSVAWLPTGVHESTL